MATINRNVLIGALLVPPAAPISFKGGRVLGLRLPEIEARYPPDAAVFRRPIGYSRGALDKRYPKRRKKKKKMEFEDYAWTVIEVDDSRAAEPTIAALVDLSTGHYRFYLNEQIRRSKPVPAGEISHGLMSPPLAHVNSHLLRMLEKGLTLTRRQQRFAIAIQRWYSSIDRSVPIDAVIDCCSSLDSLFNVQQELRLRLAMAVYSYVRADKRKARSLVYGLYGRRNEFVHGQKVPEVTDAERREVTQLTARILRQCILAGSLPRIPPDALFAP